MLTNIEKAGYTIFMIKLQLCSVDIRIVSFICDDYERHYNFTKIVKIVQWRLCNNAIETKTFIELCVYYKIFIKDFAVIFAPIYQLLKKNAVFKWDPEQQATINVLKMKFIGLFALMIIDYKSDENIIMTTDVNLQRWREVLMQMREKKNTLHNTKAKYEARSRRNMMRSNENVEMFWNVWKSFVIIFMMCVLFWKQMQKFWSRSLINLLWDARRAQYFLW